MTERLSQLLHDEASDLVPPAPDAHRILADGRRLRRRHQVTSGLAAAAAVAVVAVVAATAVLVGPDRGPDTASIPRDAVVYGWQSEVHIGDRTVSVEGTVDRIDHTGAGLFVTTSTPDRLLLVRADGSRVDLGEAPTWSGSVPTTSPRSDVYVQVEARDDTVVAVVRDLDTGRSVDEITVDPPNRREGRLPLVDLDGDTLHLDFRKGRTVAVGLNGSTAGGESFAQLEYVNTVNGGRTITGNRDQFSVIDVFTGEDLLTVPTDGLVNSRLSPDGRWYVVLRRVDDGDPDGRASASGPDRTLSFRMSFYDVATGAEKTYDGEADAPGGWVWGWTRDGDLFWIDEGTLTRCEPGTGQCQDARLELPGYAGPALAEVW
jgi:hypothetical protein